jgi:septum site-determining protein MinC
LQTVEIKPWRNGLLKELLVEVPIDLEWDEALTQLEARLKETRNSAVGRDAQLTLDLGNRAVPAEELVALTDRLRYDYGLIVVAIVATHQTTQEIARQLVLNTYLMPPGGSLEAAEAGAYAGNNALYVPNTVRSGQRIVHAGTVIVGGDVNAGAEVIAEGDILVFGTLRGLAHAGYRGDERARIIAGNMRPQQVRIATRIARSPEESGRIAPGSRTPEVARIEQGEIQVSPV